MTEHAPAPSYPANTAPTPGMSAEQQYIFDLAGYCVIANVLSPEELRALNAAVRGPRALALSLCTTAHPLHTIFAKIIGTSLSGMTLRPNPRWTGRST